MHSVYSAGALSHFVTRPPTFDPELFAPVGLSIATIGLERLVVSYLSWALLCWPLPFPGTWDRAPLHRPTTSKLSIARCLRMAKMYHKNLSTWHRGRWED